jgi:glycosyltransferase involved in cell wall biosynthesis
MPWHGTQQPAYPLLRAWRLPLRAVRIAFVTETYPPEVNGVALTTARTVAHLRSAGHEVQLVRPRQPQELPRADVYEWRTAGQRLPMYPELRLGWATAAGLQRAWREAPPQLVHVATPGPLGLNALRAARAAGIAASADFRTNFHTFAPHYGFGWAGPLVLRYLRGLHARADVNFVPTQALADHLATLGFERLVVVGRGVDAQQFSPRRRDAALRECWQAGTRDTVLLYVGRLAREKGVSRVFDVFERWQRLMPRLRLVVVGDGPMRDSLQQRHPDAIFMGVQRGGELARIYASADLFLFPSRSDTFGNVVLEAAASGLVIAAYDEAAAHQHLRDGISACLARGDDDLDFDEAAARALWICRAPYHPMRLLARQQALAADWPRVLRRFEVHLRAAAESSSSLVLPHASVA